MDLGRRDALAALAAALASARLKSARGAAPEADGGSLDVRAIAIDGAEGTGARAHEVLIALPTRVASAAPLVVLLHGLAETADERLGSRAWLDRYGLAAAADGLARGLAFVTPFVPRLADAQLSAYARWVTDRVVPRARAEGGPAIDAAITYVGGCSYGGRVSLEVFLRAPDRFGAWAGVQTAIPRASASAYAERLARVAGGRPLLVETSTLDPFRDASEDLAASLRARGTACELLVLPGPHDQPWLRRAGTPRALGWLDRLRG